MKSSIYVFAILIFLLSQSAFARLNFSSSVFYTAESGQDSETKSEGRQFYSLDAFAGLDNKSRFFGGFHVHQITMTNTTATTSTFSSLDMGPSLTWVIDKKGIYSFYVAYNITAEATYSAGGTATAAKWSGTSILANFGVQPEIGKDLRVGVLLNYYSASYGTQIVGTTSDTVAYSRTWMFPSLVLTWRN